MPHSQPRPPIRPQDAWPHVLGLRLAPLTFDQTLHHVDELICAREPAYVVTANLHYANLVAADPRLQAVNDEAALLVADGMPLVWASRFNRYPLPERVAGSDLTPALCERAAARGYRVYLFGAGPNVAEKAAEKLCQRFPGLTIAGVYSPSRAELDPAGDAENVARIRRARPQLLFLALGQPHGELWLRRNYRDLGPVVSMQVGATLDFIAGQVARAPKWMQLTGLEWVYRMLREPQRLGPRYVQDLRFLIGSALRSRRPVANAAPR